MTSPEPTSADTVPEARAAGTRRKVLVWDPAVRIFHWLLVVLVGFNIYTGNVGGIAEMEWHVRSGCAILALVLFRIGWGLIGTPTARFAHFVKGWGAVLAYARALLRAGYRASVGHNPLGGWSVLAMLSCLLVQAATGLFSNDDILTEGPLAYTVSKATSDAITGLHDTAANVLYVLISIHVVAVLGYWLVKKENLIAPMLTGRKWVGGDERIPPPPALAMVRAAFLFAIVVTAVWTVVG